MQYKIPVQIENEDPIVFGLSLKQLIIMMVGGAIAYGIFTSLEKNVWWEIALIPTLIILAITLLIALFKKDEMTFFPFMLALLRFNINLKERSWRAGIDSFSPLDIWIIVNTVKKEDSKVEVQDKSQKIKTLEDTLHKI